VNKAREITYIFSVIAQKLSPGISLSGGFHIPAQNIAGIDEYVVGYSAVAIDFSSPILPGHLPISSDAGIYHGRFNQIAPKRNVIRRLQVFEYSGCLLPIH
jgi:hypothetical protein